MNRVTLSQVIEALNNDSDLKKIAAETESPVSEQVGTSTEDQKAKVQTQLMELAGKQTEQRSDAVAAPLNLINTPPAGEKAAPKAVTVSEGHEMGEVVASALEKLEPEERKVAAQAIIEKIAALKVFTPDEAAALKTAKDKHADDEIRGRVMARGFHDEINKLAALDQKALEAAAAEQAKTEKAAEEKKAEDKAAAEKKAEETKKAAETPSEEDRLIAELCGK